VTGSDWHSRVRRGADLCWLGGMPAHYMRRLHREIEETWGERVQFIYVTPRVRNPHRAYETGLMPNALILNAGSSDVRAVLRAISPRALLVAGHRPADLLWGAVSTARRGIPTCYWADTNIADVRNRPWLRRTAERWAKRSLLRHMRILLHVGARGREFFLWVGGPSFEAKLRWLPYPAVLPAVTDRSARGSARLGVLFLGRLSPEKGVGRLIEAFALSPLLQARAVLTLAGDGPERAKLEAQASLLPPGTVTFTGSVASDSTSALFQAADVLVLPSFREAWGLVVNEALAAGLAVVAPRWVGAAADLVLPEETGLVLDDNAPVTIAAALERLAREPGAAHRMGSAGARLVREGGWSLAGALKQFAALMDEVGR
jgi:glycosyltransferase involved in cell wall biosynthesis